MNISKPWILTTAAVIVLSAAAGASIVIAKKQQDDHGDTRPLPGTYAHAPELAWWLDVTSISPDFDANSPLPVYATGENYVTSLIPHGGGLDRRSHLIGIDPESGEVLWEQQPDERLCSVSQDPAQVFCEGELDRNQRRLTAYDSGTGAKIGTAAFEGDELEFVFLNGILYSCYSTEDSVVIQAGTIEDPDLAWRQTIASSLPSPCDLHVNSVGATASFADMSDDMYRSVAVSTEGQIVVDKPGGMAYPGGERVFRIVDMESDESHVYDATGVELFTYSDSYNDDVAIISDNDGQELLIDASGVVREMNTGEILWTYRKPDDAYTTIGRIGDVAMISEGSLTLRAFLADSGEELWNRSLHDIGGDQSRLSATDTETAIFTNSRQGGSVAIDLSEGKVLWRTEVENGISAVNRNTFISVEGSVITAYRF